METTIPIVGDFPPISAEGWVWRVMEFDTKTWHSSDHYFATAQDAMADCAAFCQQFKLVRSVYVAGLSPDGEKSVMWRYEYGRWNHSMVRQACCFHRMLRAFVWRKLRRLWR